MSGEDAPRPYLENLIVGLLEIKTNKQRLKLTSYYQTYANLSLNLARKSNPKAPSPYLENLIVPEIKTNKQTPS
jgi:hypothetical protein